MTRRFQLPDAWPAAADPGAGERLVQRFSALGQNEADLARDAAAARMLRALGGNSPFLTDLALREHETLLVLCNTGPQSVVGQELSALRELPLHTARGQLAAALRRAKRRVALAAAIADIGGIWRLEQVTAALSELAETALALSVAHLLGAAHDAGELALPHPDDPARESGFTVLGMGKLGARELNYSSDVDLVLLHDPEAGVYHGDAASAFFARIARGLVALMEARDADGYVFRTDLRLRPDPAATAPCIALPAAIAYYESMGQNWERAAMLKARPLAGDIRLGEAFLEAIRPFVWRRHLDFAALADIHAMKRRIDEQKKASRRGSGIASPDDPVAQIAGYNVKLGQGGIREIEFLAQTLQLVWGGRDPALRTPRTLEALRLLAGAGHLTWRAAGELASGYRFLRRVEHRLQMVADRQTHALPDRRDALESFARFMGMDDAASFAAVLLRHMRRVQARYLDVFEMVPGDPEAVSDLDFSGVGEAHPATVAALQDMGFANPEAIVAAVRAWQAGRVRALRSHRARELMATVLPSLLRALARQTQPDIAFGRFDAFLGGLPAGVQLLSVFGRNPALVDRVAAVLGAAPSLAGYLARTPSAIEGLLLPEEEHTDVAGALRRRLSDARTLEDAIGIIRSVVREADFSISVATMEGRTDADDAGVLRTGLADAAIAALLPRVLADFAERFGIVRGGALAVVVLGKAGGREMMAGSDLDLMLIYHHPARAQEGTVAGQGRRALAASQYFIRAVHAFVAALTAPDAQGPLYAVDMRLRPSGNKGPVAVSLAAFERYHAAAHGGGGAWTWERMALTRARVVAGPPALRARVRAAIQSAMIAAGPPERIRADAAAMRGRLLRDLPQAGPWDVKLRPGGQIEVEFVAQVLQLIHEGARPDLASPTTRIALLRLRDAGLLDPLDAAILIRADRVWRTVQGMLRITYGRAAPDRLSEASADALLRAAQAAGAWAADQEGAASGATVDLDGLRATLAALADQVRSVFVRQVGEIGL